MKSLWDELNGPGAETNYLGGRRIYDPLPDFNCNDPQPVAIPRASRLRAALPWIAAAVLIAVLAVCVFPYAGLAWLEVTK